MGEFRVFSVVLLLSLMVLVGCQTTGQAYLNAGGDVLFDVQRTLTGTTVTLDITNTLSGGSDLVVVVESLPVGSSFVDGSYSLVPAILNDDKTIAMWILSPSAQSLTQFSIAAGIPASISYSYAGGTLLCSDISGKYGVDDGGAEPYEDTTGCTSSTPVASCVNCPAVTVACAQGDVYVEETCEECGHCEAESTGGATISDVTAAISNYLGGSGSISTVTNVITQYLNQ